jgi:hypothetical protein
LEERYAKAEKANDMLNLTIKMMSERASTKEEQLGKEIEELRKALTEISEGKGRYNTDPFTHARNTIEDMVQLATEALSKG